MVGRVLMCRVREEMGIARCVRTFRNGFLLAVRKACTAARRIEEARPRLVVTDPPRLELSYSFICAFVWARVTRRDYG